MRIFHILSMATLLATGVIEARKPKGEVVNTQMNKADIAADDVCRWHARKNIIRCNSGRVIKNPIQKESALTGTPGYLSGAGYIGYVVTKPSTPNLMGSGKRIDFYLRQS
jgi:hypothetical protein